MVVDRIRRIFCGTIQPGFVFDTKTCDDPRAVSSLRM